MAWFPHLIGEEAEGQRKVLPLTAGPGVGCMHPTEGVGLRQCGPLGVALLGYRTPALEWLLPGHLRKGLLPWNHPQELTKCKFPSFSARD